MLDYVRDFSSHLKAFLITKFLVYSQEAFIQFFINIYFWRMTHNIPFLVLYNVVYLICQLIAYFPAGKISKEYSRFVPLRAGLVLKFLFLMLILFLKGSIVDYIVPVAVIGGLGAGLYWSSDDLLKFDLSNPNNRLRFAAVFTILSQIASSMMPLIASLLIVMNGDGVVSYSNIFLASMLLTCLALASTFFISKKDRFRSKEYSFSKAARALWKDRNIRIACISTTLSYVNYALPILLGLLLFITSGTELSIGAYQFITVIVAVVANYTVGAIFSRKDYRKLLIYGGLVNFAVIFILFLRQDFTSILIYGILASLFSAASTPFYPMTQDSLSTHAKGRKELVDLRVEYMALVQIFSVAGQVAGFLILLLLAYSMSFTSIASVAALMAFASFLGNVSMARMKDGKRTNIDWMN